MHVVIERDHLNVVDYPEPLFDSRELLAIDISDPERAAAALPLAAAGPEEFLRIVDPTPFGSLLVRQTDASGTAVSLLNLEDSGLGFGPFVPAGMSSHAELSHAWATGDGAAMLVFARPQNGDWGLHWVAFEGKTPTTSAEIYPDTFSFTAISPDHRHVAFSRTDDVAQITYLYLVELDPEPQAPTLIASLNPPSSQLRVFLTDSVLTYDYDLDMDGIEDIVAIGLDDPLAPPVRVTTAIHADHEMGKSFARRWSADGKLAYWTGVEKYGDLYLVEFTAGKPEAPVLLSTAELPARNYHFNFEVGGGLFYTFGDAQAGMRGIAQVALDGESPAAPVVASEALEPDSEIVFVRDDVQERQDRGDARHLIYQVAGPHLTRIAHIEFSADGPAPARTLFDGFDMDEVDMEIEVPARRWLVAGGKVDGKLRVFSIDLENPATTWLDGGMPAAWTPKRFVVSPDERQVVIEAQTETGRALLRGPIDGTRPLEQLVDGDGFDRIAFISP